MSIRTLKFRQGRSRPNQLNAQVLRAREFAPGFVSCTNSSNATIEGGQADPSRPSSQFFGRVRSDRLQSDSRHHPESKENFY